MPYIKDEDRFCIEMGRLPKTPGELNYYITAACLTYLSETERKYADYNAIVGALECAKLEFYRRAVAAYEDEKIKENGDIY